MIIRNFLFHRVSDEKDGLWPPMPTSLFESLVAYITRHYQVIKLEDSLLSGLPRSTGKKLATILFDDGYKDNIEFAVPILDKYKCPASFYVVTSCIDQNIPTWTYMVDHLFQNTGVSSVQLDMNFVPEKFKNNELANESQRLQAGSQLKPWMKSLSNDERRQVLDQLQKAFSDVPVPVNRMMSWNDLRQMQSAGYTIGSHSVSHPLLASIKEEKDLLFEVQESGKRIKTELGGFPLTISYPIGSFDERVIACSKKAGYKLGLAVKQQFYNTSKDDLFAIPRVELYHEPFWKCRLRISGVYNWVKNRMPS